MIENWQLLLYIIIGVIVALWVYKTEVEKLDEVDEPMANIIMTLVCIFWPAALFIMLIRKIQTM